MDTINYYEQYETLSMTRILSVSISRENDDIVILNPAGSEKCIKFTTMRVLYFATTRREKQTH